MKISKIILAAAASMMVASACSNEIPMKRPPKVTIPELEEVTVDRSFKAPMYWSVYEYCIENEFAGVPDWEQDIQPEEWAKILDWVAKDLKPHGINMVCTDGFIPMLAKDDSGYMTHYGSMKLEDLVAMAKERGLEVAVYDNPLWIHGPETTKIPGLELSFGNLRFNESDQVANRGAQDKFFSWVVASHAGTYEYIDGFFKHYADLGVKMVRMDFLSWYEDGRDRNMGVVGRGYGREAYARALNYIAKAAAKYGIFTSLVMPHMYDDAALEAKYGHMTRIVGDTRGGGWFHTSADSRGQSYSNWPNCNNQFDGFTYWSHIAGRGKVILDGDFLRLNQFENDDEKRTAVSLQLLAGGPIAVADQYNTIGDNLQFYANDELNALNADGFVGKPLSTELNNADNMVWYGSLSNGDVIVGLFNRNDAPLTYNLALSRLGLSGEFKVYDMWTKKDEGSASTLTAVVPPHGCKVVRLTK